MNTIRSYIDERQCHFAQHVFFDHLLRSREIESLAAFAEAIAFWVMTFQDVLRLNEARISSPSLRRIATHHRAEDSGHDEWFLHDLHALSNLPPDMRLLFGRRHDAAREAAFALMSEVFFARTDRERILLLFALESASHVTFERTASFLQRNGVTLKLRYFSRDHLAVEKDHELFDREIEALLGAEVLSPDEAESARALVDRVYAAFHRMFDAAHSVLRERKAESFSQMRIS